MDADVFQWGPALSLLWSANPAKGKFDRKDTKKEKVKR